MCELRQRKHEPTRAKDGSISQTLTEIDWQSILMTEGEI
jgi:hypothetical protein